MMAIIEFEDEVDSSEVETSKEAQKQKLIDALNKLGINYDINGDQVRIPGLASEIYNGTIIVDQPPDTRIVFEEYADVNKIVLNTTGPIKPGLIQIVFDKSVKAYYDFPYLIVQFG